MQELDVLPIIMSGWGTFDRCVGASWRVLAKGRPPEIVSRIRAASTLPRTFVRVLLPFGREGYRICSI
jgi:hypothetical protein